MRSVGVNGRSPLQIKCVARLSVKIIYRLKVDTFEKYYNLKIVHIFPSVISMCPHVPNVQTNFVAIALILLP